MNRSVPSAPARRRWPARAGRGGLAIAAVLAGLAATPLAPPPAAAAAPDLLVDPTSTWRYLQDDTFPGAGDLDPVAWTRAAFDDSAWLSGRGTFGGKIDSGVQSGVYDAARTATTPLEMNAPGSGDRVRTYFFRSTFTLTAEQIAEIAAVRGTLRSDDGAIVYVNGTEVTRNDVPAGSEGLAYASGETTGLDSTAVSFGPEVLVPGENTVAVEVHNDRPSSSDVWFELTELDALSAEEARARPTRIILTPTEDPATSQSVTFQGAEPEHTAGRVQYRPAAGGAVKQVNAPLQPRSASNDFGHFSATITGLRPATEYAYRVASDGAWSDWQEFETEDPAEREFSYLYFGDAQIGLDSTWPKVVDQARATAPDAVGSVHAGDLIDTASNDTQWGSWFDGMAEAAATTNVMAAPGNHEYSGDRLMTAWKAHFEYPHHNPNDSTIGEMARLAVGDDDVARQYRAYFDHWSDFAAETVYFADYQGVRFITVNATRDTTFLTPATLPGCTGADCPSANVAALWTRFQAQWLDHVLETSEAKWNVVTFHQPVYSTSQGRDEPVLREHWVPVFEKHDVDLVQMGHDHTYARGYRDTSATGVPGVTDGPVYVVSNSGAKHYDLATDATNVWTANGATQVQKAQDITTYQVVDVAEDRLTYRSYIAEISGTGTYYRDGRLLDPRDFQVGDLWDEFTVHKTDDGQKAVVEAGLPAPEFEDRSPVPTFGTDLPARTPVVVGRRSTLSVDVVADGVPAHQWQVLRDGAWADLPGETGPRLSLGRITAADVGERYRVRVRVGTRTVTSTETVLVDTTAAPVLTTDLPARRQVLSGGALTLRVAASAEAPVRYQWQRQVRGAWTDLVGRTGPTLELGEVRGAAARYRVVATAGTRSTVSRATTVVVAKRASSVSLAGAVLRGGRPATLRVRTDRAGRVAVLVRQGARRWTTAVAVRGGRATVRLGRPVRRGGPATVRLRFTPSSPDHAPSRVTRTGLRVR